MIALSSPPFRLPNSHTTFRVLSLVLFGLLAGCQRSATDSTAAGDSPNRDALARQLLREVRDAYSAATRYHDDAKLVVRYQLEGRPMEEHQLWAIDFERPLRLAARFYNARIQSDDRRTTVMVFDFDSENMDNQYLVLPVEHGVPWKKLFGDSVCRHFISGSTEIPFNPEVQNESLLPPTIGLLMNHPDVAWLDRPESVERLEDAEFQGQTYHRIKLTHERRSYELWIEPQTKLVRQVILPNQFLDSALLAAPEITGLRLSVQFDNATFEPNWPTPPFTTELPDTANPVTQFVPLPEPFPSEWIGKKIPDIALTDAKGSIQRWSPPGKTSVIAWVDRQSDSLEMIRLLESSQKTSDSSGVEIQLCFADLPSPNPQVPHQSELSQFIHEAATSLPVSADVGLLEGVKLGVKFAPAAIVVDDSGQAQYLLTTHKDDWRERLVAAIRRVHLGENLAAEMRAEYNQFLDEYQSKLQAFHPDPSSVAPVVKHTAHQRSSNKVAVRTPIWTSNELKSPGNIVAVSPTRVWIHEGWQSAAELDLAAETLQIRKLPVDGDRAVSVMRVGTKGASNSIAAFGERGKIVVTVADDGTQLGQFVPEGDAQICDVRFAATLSDSGKSTVWILTSDGQLREFDESLAQIHREITLEAAESFVVLPEISDEKSSRILMVRSDGGLTLSAADGSGQKSFTFGSLKVHRICPASELFDNSRIEGGADRWMACATALDDRGQWVAVGINANLEVQWTQPIGPQEFDHTIQPIAAGRDISGRNLWAVASGDHSITVFDDSGAQLDQVGCSHPIHGLGIIRWREKVALLIADSERLSVCELQLEPSAD